MSQKLGVTIDFLITGKESGLRMVAGEEPGKYGEPKFRLVPIISWARAGQSGDYEELPEDWQESTRTDCPDPKAFALKIEGDSMEPVHKEGDVVIVMPSFKPYPESLVVARFKNGDVAFKLMSFLDADGERMRLTSFNPTYPPRDLTTTDLAWIYPVYGFNRVTWNSQRWKAQFQARLENGEQQSQPEFPD